MPSFTMHRAVFPALLLAGTFAGSAALAQSSGGQSERGDGRRDVLACYELDGFNEVYKLDIKFHSRLSERREERKFDHPRQFAFSVHGKHVGTCGRGTVRPVVGTLISTVPVGTAGGARLGLESFNTTGVPNFCRDVEISCKSAGDGFPPKAWNCFGQNKFNVEFEFKLNQVKEDEDERCSLFEDGREDDASFFAQPPAEGTGSGMQQMDDQ